MITVAARALATPRHPGPPPTVGVGSMVCSGCGLLLTAASAGDAGRLYSGGAVGRRKPRNVSRPWAGTTTVHRIVVITGKISSY